MMRIISLLCLFTAVSFAFGATIPTMEVTVTNAAGKVAYKGRTSASGAYATGKLEPGNYVVQFDAKGKIAKGEKFALSAIAGKINISSDSVAGERIVNPGVAMRITVESSSQITGQVAPAGSVSKQTAAAGSAKQYNAPTKIIKGKRYIWVTAYTGSTEGGHWAEEGSPEAMQAVSRYKGNTQPPVSRSMSGGY